jgi:hypothetical protein
LYAFSPQYVVQNYVSPWRGSGAPRLMANLTFYHTASHINHKLDKQTLIVANGFSHVHILT